jgi:hypothetical protein
MRNYLLGVATGLAVYHYVLGGSNQELITEMRSWVKSVDDRLAEAEKGSKPEDTPPGTPTEPPVYKPEPPQAA